MVPKPSTEAPGAMGAADIHVETWLESQAAELADADRRSLARCEHEGVGSWPRFHRGARRELKV